MMGGEMKSSALPSTVKGVVWLALALALAACAASSRPSVTGESAGAKPEPEVDPPTPTSFPAAALPDLGPAPDFANETWLNTDRPLNLSALRGKVVLVEFWTFG